MSFVRITRSPLHLYITERRVHHFWIGLFILLSDAKDWRVWVSDLKRSTK